MTGKTKLSEAEIEAVARKLCEIDGTNPSAVAAEIGEAFRLLTDALQMFELDDRCNDPDDDAYVWRHHTSDLLQRIQTKSGGVERGFEACRKKYEGLADAARLLIADVKDRHPGEDLRCPYMIALDNALRALTPNTDREELPSDWLAKEVDAIGPETDKWPDGIKQSFEDATQPTPQQEAEPVGAEELIDRYDPSPALQKAIDDTKADIKEAFDTPPKGEDEIEILCNQLLQSATYISDMVPYSSRCQNLRHKAIDTIKSLREERDTYQSVCKAHDVNLKSLMETNRVQGNENDILKAQVEKLREALREIGRGHSCVPGATASYSKLKLQGIANTALSQTEGA